MDKIISPLKRNMKRSSVGNLQDGLRLILERSALFGDDVPSRVRTLEAIKPEREEIRYGRITIMLVRKFQEEHRIEESGDVDETTADALNKLLDELGAFKPPTVYRVSGRVTSRVSAAVSGLRVEVVDKSVGGDVVLGEDKTDVNGSYKVSFKDSEFKDRGKDKPDLQVRVFAANDPLASSIVRYDASARETLNVFINDEVSDRLASEHEALKEALAVNFKGSLSELEETDERQDITYLANKSGWDARAVALAALSEQFSAQTRGSRRRDTIDPAFFYALFRAGVPANDRALYRTAPDTVRDIWVRAIEKDVIPRRLKEHFDSALERFREISAKSLLEEPSAVGVSTFKEVLDLSLDDAEEQKKFAELYTRRGSDLTSFWNAVEEQFGNRAATRLRLDGQLAYLTLNNAPLIAALHKNIGRPNGGPEERRITQISQLVFAGFHQAEKWLGEIGGSNAPSEIPGKNPAEKRKNYAEFLAAQVRLSFPTAVVAKMVKDGETVVRSEAQRQNVYMFLASEQAKDFEISQQPIARFVAKKNIQANPEMIREITRIQRVLQITPTDSAMNGLLKENIDSAYAVTRFERDDFVNAYKSVVGGEETARAIHEKARQVHEATLNVAVSFLTAKQTPGIGVHSAPAYIDPAPTPPKNVEDVLAYSTLEGLFGSMDYCSCEHCRSILSPAAYLVDLLKFLDQSENLAAGFENPLEVLLNRRNDIQHLPLTCENTLTPVPYIDLVNEVLEHFVVNGLSLADYQGHTTDDDVAPEDLLASPQFVSEAAYDELRGLHAQFPPPLPFHQPLETLRRLFDEFEAPLPRVMADLRTDDELERGGEDVYGWRDVWMETLKLSRAEYRLLAESWQTGDAIDVLLTAKRLFGFDTIATEEAVLAELEDAKEFCRRVQISAAELVEIIETRFINPNATLIPRFKRLKISPGVLKAFKAGALSDEKFDALISSEADPAHYNDDIKAWGRNESNYAGIMGLIALTNPDDPGDVCDLAALKLRYLKPDEVTGRPGKLRLLEFIRIVRFIRLWKKLGWSIQETDKALAALIEQAQPVVAATEVAGLERLDADLEAMLPRLGIAVRAMTALKLSRGRDLLSLLACFGPIDTHGKSALYRKMFLSPAREDEAFREDIHGEYLSDKNAKLLDHAETLRAAFSLTGDEFNQIVGELEFGANNSLELDAISEIYRRGWLSRVLNISVRELDLLCKFCGLNPFGAQDPSDPAILRLLDLVKKMKQLGIKTEQALYLIWNRDLGGKSAPAEENVTTLARDVRAALSTVETDFSLVDDPDGAIARSQMALVYGNEVTDTFFGFLETTFVTEVTYDHTASQLEEPILDAAPGQIAYDDFRKVLIFRGVFTDGLLASVMGESPSAEFNAAVTELYSKANGITKPFFDGYPDLEELHKAYMTSPETEPVKRKALLEGLLPDLKRQRKRQQAQQTAGSFAGVDAGMTAALLDDANVLHAEHTEQENAGPALKDLVALESTGLSLEAFDAATTNGPQHKPADCVGSLDYSNGGDNPLPPNKTTPGSPISGIWSGYLEAPENGNFNFQIETDPLAVVTLELDGADVELSNDNGLWTNKTCIPLRAGVLERLTLTVTNLKDKLCVRWESPGRVIEVIPNQHLYSARLTDRMRQVYTRYLKASALANALKLKAPEIAHLATDNAYAIGGAGWLNALPVDGDPDDASAAALLKAFQAALDFARLKADFSPGDTRLLTLIKDPDKAMTTPESLGFVVTRWEPKSLEDLLKHFEKTKADLGELKTLARVYDAYRWVNTLGIPAAALIDATTNEPSAAIVRDFKAALRARYDHEGWRKLLQPLNDELRKLQRDALVAYILHHMRADPQSQHIDTPEKLFEYFLMDVQMEPCMLTSRVRHALSSVQIFVERCLMKLEKFVSPKSLNAKHWEWMKRYRVWEANRKIFLYPENWLYPELRDDQSPFFTETMSELLQGDITEDRAATALITYLTKLEEVAKLEICGVHYVEDEQDRKDNVLHVIGRTSGANRKYFYRRRDHGSWTPWEKIGLDIEDNPVLPVIWKDRLFLFWLKLMPETVMQEGGPKTPTADSMAEADPAEMFDLKAPKGAMKAMLSWSEYLDGKWQPSRTSDPQNPILLETDTSVEDLKEIRANIRLGAFFWPGGLRIIVTDRDWQGPGFFLYNTFSVPETRDDEQPHLEPELTLHTTSQYLFAVYETLCTSHVILRNSIAHRAIAPNHHDVTGDATWKVPYFFYEDSRHTFLVTATKEEYDFSNSSDFGVVAKTGIQPVDIADLVLKPPKKGEEVLEPTRKSPGFGVVDPIPYDRFVTEDAHINTGIGTPGTVSFGGTEIGPMGSAFSRQINREKGRQ